MNGRQSIPDLAMAKALDLGAEQATRIPIVFKCAECGVGFKTAHFVPESKAPKDLTGMIVPSICLTCVEKQREQSTPEA